MSAPTPPGFIRAFDPINDADTVAQLIVDSFSLKNDSEGMRVLNQMRENARRARENSWFSPSQTTHPGYVWMLDGQLVGNITIISFLERLRHIALIANVAVRPELRGQGIASALTQQALRYVKATRAAEVWLQVNDDNEAAKHLYSSMGFQLVRKVNSWELTNGITTQGPYYDLPAGFSVDSRRLWDWGKHKTCLRQSYPPDTRWYASLEFSRMAPWSAFILLNWDDRSSLTHFALRQSKELVGVLSWQRGLPRNDLLWLGMEPGGMEEQRVYALLAHFFSYHWQQRAVKMEYPAGRAEESLSKLGFKLSRQINWMKLR